MTECFTCYLNLSKSRTGCLFRFYGKTRSCFCCNFVLLIISVKNALNALIRRYDVNTLTLLTANVDVTLRGAVMVKKALTPRTQTANVKLRRRNIVV